MPALPRNTFVLIENVTPSVDGGRYPSKAIAGTPVVVEADIFRDGLASIEARILWKREFDSITNSATMKFLDNDRWRGEFPVRDPGRYVFTIQANTIGLKDITHAGPFAVVVDRPIAMVGTWYELFVRSQGKGNQPGTFDDAAKRLPDIKKMGFDVVYLAPIHPIGRTGRKGKNNALNAGPSDPGSPWAIGNQNGGHMAIEPLLGTFDQFDQFVKSAKDLGIEIAMDFALQCSPDHPWVREHPSWFYRNPDGTLKTAENPPHKYEDISFFNFDSPDAESLWVALKDVILFWAFRGLRTFRVDNPHTKPVAFWQWLISEVKVQFPDVIFLAEAFTRPKMMKALSKAGFSQSYTYFIWRNSKRELEDYMTELTTSGMEMYFRPNFFINTPDVLHEVLQKGGRPAFQMRLALAATLSPTYGIYSGYELCENEALPGTEEYANSEKFEIKNRDWDKSGNIKDLITKYNEARRKNPALQQLTNLTFLNSSNDHVFAALKMSENPFNAVISVVNMDPFNVQKSSIRIPLDRIGVPWGQSFRVRDLLTGATYNWSEHNEVILDPQAVPAHLLVVERS